MCDISTIRCRITTKQLDRSLAEPLDVGVLNGYQRPLPVMTDYDQLLSAAEVMP